ARGPSRSCRLAPRAHRNGDVPPAGGARRCARDRAPLARQDAGPGADRCRSGRAGRRRQRRRVRLVRPAAATRRTCRAPGHARLDATERARWRAADRDRPTRRLIPWVLAAARRAAARRRHTELARLDALVSRLALGMTAGEELLLAQLLERRAPLTVRDVLAWHERLPPC